MLGSELSLDLRRVVVNQVNLIDHVEHLKYDLIDARLQLQQCEGW
jgi:hypothetical protein